MKHMNPKLVKLLREGFSMTTLEKFSKKQIDILYEKVKEEAKEIINVKKGSPQEKDLMSKGETFNTYETEIEEKAVSKKQRGLMGAAYSVEKGEKDLEDIPKSYRKKVEKVVDSMSKKQVKDFASTKDKGLPEKKEPKEDSKKMEKKTTKNSEKNEIKKLEENILKLVDKYIPPHTTKSDLLHAIKRYKH